MTGKQERYGVRLLGYFSDDFGDVLIRKLSAKELDQLIDECKESERDYLRRWCQRVESLGLQKKKLAAIAEAATPEVS